MWLLWLGLWHILGTSKADGRFLYLISWTLSHPKHPVQSTLSFLICMLKGEKLLGCALILASTLKSLPGEGCGAAACNPALVVEAGWPRLKPAWVTLWVPRPGYIARLCLKIQTKTQGNIYFQVSTPFTGAATSSPLVLEDRFPILFGHFPRFGYTDVYKINYLLNFTLWVHLKFFMCSSTCFHLNQANIILKENICQTLIY